MNVTIILISKFLTARTGKTVNFLRAPDEYHFIVPFNLIEGEWMHLTMPGTYV